MSKATLTAIDKNLRMPTSDEISAYNTINDAKNKSGIYHKTCFHLHTPASYDYKLKNEWKAAEYERSSAEEILKLCQSAQIILPNVTIDDISEKDICGFVDKKEFLSYLLLAESLITQQIEIVLVADHNTIDGVDKLRTVHKWLGEHKTGRNRLEILLGVEISCADKNHVVGLFEDSEQNRNRITNWFKEKLISKEDGVYVTSIEALAFISECSAVGYIAHINSSDILTKRTFSGGYKKRLFAVETVRYVGITSIEVKDRVAEQIRAFRKKPVQFILDCDAHDVDSVGTNCFWIKGGTCGYNMVREALNDYNISVEFDCPNHDKQYIKGLLLRNGGNGFLTGKTEQDLCIHLSSALNCLIGGRGTGKSSILELLEYGLSQYCRDEVSLEFICKYDDLWILYQYEREEYLIRVNLPRKIYEEDSILSCFGQNYTRKYHYKYDFDRQAVKEYAGQHYLRVSKIVPKGAGWMIEQVPTQTEILSKFFDTKYSINELVNTASGDKIHSFIADTMLKNKTLSAFGDMSSFRRKSGLTKMLDRAEEILAARRDEVKSVIDPFNERCQNTLRIVYSQGEYKSIPAFESMLFGAQADERKWYKKLNITHVDVIDYITELFVSLGPIKFYKMLVTENVDTAEKAVRIKKYCTSLSPKMIDSGISELRDVDVPQVIIGLFQELTKESNIVQVKDYFRSYVTEIENFSLEFNINNREGGAQQAIFKKIRELSLGQKVVAMLSFVLGYSDFSGDYRPLIIDQPEDNLDNQYIYKNLVDQLRKIKERRQVIIATHNATIVTNAKADLVCVMESDNKHGWVETSGYPSDSKIKLKILNHLEGGKESFLHKIDIYRNVVSSESGAFCAAQRPPVRSPTVVVR